MDKFQRAPVPPRAIYLLAWGDTTISPLSGIVALRRFVAAATYRGELLTAMGCVAAQWRRCSELLRAVSVWEFARPRDWSAMDRH